MQMCNGGINITPTNKSFLVIEKEPDQQWAGRGQMKLLLGGQSVAFGNCLALTDNMVVPRGEYPQVLPRLGRSWAKWEPDTLHYLCGGNYNCR